MIHIFRSFLYIVLFIFSIVLMSLCAVRIHYTEHLSPFDPLNDGVRFYDPIVALLLATSLLTILWSAFVGHTIHGRHERRIIGTFLHEFLGLGVLFILWLVGAAIATVTSNVPTLLTRWGNLSSCWHYSTCRILTALLAFAWLGWIVVLALLLTTLLFALANRAWNEQMHGRWDPRATRYRDSRV
ncbi:hypothetical protein CONPUDRAFT_132619 [Coniophora puteana RWD-64-598 SS2]|uniref:MARVEL domain-containing protein n=1 Tax=Coniophora puteana (strain RWD-64-598) TaxID=741705 RepID=A0A5M3M6N3_CONPW|nr:uncharacterized protein CONPUDRAFT_132619 [Coniophora puteana RWD-64-598 SS2]EIW75022.1 hypothetical protein CONPUDRAFT_132619 [Coniophora puteana RWD-64-598 SS2]